MAAAAAGDDDKAIVYLILRYLEDRSLFRTARTLERETGVYFNMKYFEDLIKSDMLDEAEHYLQGFTSLHDNVFSARVFFLIRHLKFLQAVNNGDIWYAHQIAGYELQTFDCFDTRIYERACHILSLDDPRNHPMIRDFDEEGTRNFVAHQCRIYISSNPIFNGKLEFPSLLTILRHLFANGRHQPPPSCEGTLMFHLISNYFTTNRNRNFNCNNGNCNCNHNNRSNNGGGGSF